MSKQTWEVEVVNFPLGIVGMFHGHFSTVVFDRKRKVRHFNGDTNRRDALAFIEEMVHWGKA